MFSHTYDTCPLVVCDHEYCYFLPRFGLLHNTTHWGKIEGTRSLVLCLFSYSKHANGRIVFQVLLLFSPVRGELPTGLNEAFIINQTIRNNLIEEDANRPEILTSPPLRSSVPPP